MKTYDVVICGLGPVGATLAVLLGRHGVRTLVLERFSDPYDKPRAIVLDWEAMRVFQFCGIAHELTETTVPHPGTDFIGIDGQIIKQFDPLPPPYALGWPATLMFIQPELERLLRARIDALDCVDLVTSAEFVEFVQDDDVVTVTYTNNTSRKACAAYLVGCDGANSTVRDACGIALNDYQFDEWWVVVDAWQRQETPLPAKTTQYCWPSRPATYVVGPQNLRRWEIKIMPGERPEEFRQGTKLRDVMARYVDVRALEIWRSAIYRFNARVGSKWRDGRVFLAGDAMHQTPPFLGQGLCAGIRDVANLSWKLIHALKRRTSDSLLDSYETERLPHVSRIIEHAKDFGLIIGELDENRGRERDRTLRAALLSGEMETSRQGFIPNLTTGILGNDALAGTLMVQPRLNDGAMMDDRLPMSFLYLALDSEAQSWAEAHVRRLKALGIERAILCAHQDETLLEWADTNKVRAALIRPDRYVWGAISGTEDMRAKLDVLAVQLGE